MPRGLDWPAEADQGGLVHHSVRDRRDRLPAHRPGPQRAGHQLSRGREEKLHRVFAGVAVALSHSHSADGPEGAERCRREWWGRVRRVGRLGHDDEDDCDFS
jgi:hypothetical protein